jgi:hypothetical protein
MDRDVIYFGLGFSVLAIFMFKPGLLIGHGETSKGRLVNRAAQLLACGSMEERMSKALVRMLIAVTLSLVGDGQITRAQSNALRFEIGGQVSAIRAENVPGSTFFLGRPDDRLDLGGGGRFTVNLNRYVALESEANFFREKFTFDLPARLTSSGTKVEGLFGAKAGIRRDKFGLFGKLRPGFMHFNRDSDCPGCSIQGNFEFALDAGGVVEFYPSRRFVVRVDAGDTMIFLDEKRHDVEGFPTVLQSAATLHRFQFSIGAGVRF